MNHPDDETIVGMCQKNNREGFELLFARYRGYIYTICRRSTLQEQDALDLTQEVLWRIVRGIGAFDRKRPLTPWIRKIAVHVCINHAAAAKREVATTREGDDALAAEVPDADPRGSPERHQQSLELRQRVREALAALPGPERTALLLRHMEERSYQEIARLMDAPEGSVKTWIFRGRRLLKKRLEDMDVWGV